VIREQATVENGRATMRGPRPRRLLLALLLPASLIVAVVAPGAASATTATVSQVVVTPAAVAVDGLSDALVTVEVVIDEPSGTPMGSAQDDNSCGVGSCAFASWSTASLRGGLHLAEVPGTRSGSQATYRGNLLVTSVDNGVWTLASVGWYVDGSNLAWTSVSLASSPVDGRSVTITGTHPPTVTSRLVPSVVPYGGRQWVQYTFRRSDGTPLVGRYVSWCYGESCFYSWWAPRASTDSHGRAAVRLPIGEWVEAAMVLPSTSRPGSWNQVFEDAPDRYEYFRDVTPSAKRAVRAGRTLTVRAITYPGYGASTALERLVGRHWRTVATAPVRASGAAFLTTISVLGPQYFRVRAYGGMAPTTSRPFVVIGTRR